ncbi:biotin transporter BioY [Agrobacterium sp. CNPSo 3708]|uniref:biotin transporter BioY n=1 Tax=unclassified Agrobacterium TaxID=2632611 RepID=UPI000DDF9395|nr:biotin transporter BioY [Agrobacterium sp. CNPSo 3708]MDD1500519.1 biotin transporter BioY [Agrobacterium sp. CNPSo 3708]
MIRTDISSSLPATRSLPRQALMIVAGVALMTLAAKTQVPFWPVPITLHTLAVMGFAVAFGPRMACAIFIAYLATGAVGLPVFSGSPERGIGLAYMIGPTGGYLAGFLVASLLTGWLAQNGTLLRRVFAMLAGLVVVYAFGMAWLLAFVPAAKVLSVGVAPFILGDLVKIGVVAAASMLLPKVKGLEKAAND